MSNIVEDAQRVVDLWYRLESWEVEDGSPTEVMVVAVEQLRDTLRGFDPVRPEKLQW